MKCAACGFDESDVPSIPKNAEIVTTFTKGSRKGEVKNSRPLTLDDLNITKTQFIHTGLRLELLDSGGYTPRVYVCPKCGTLRIDDTLL